MRHSSSTTLLRGIDILEAVGDRGELRATELCALLDVPRPTMYRAVSALVDRGYLERGQRSASYRLGPALLRLGGTARQVSLAAIAEPALRELAAETRETVNLAAVEGRIVRYTAIVDSSYSLRPSAVVGDQVAAHATAIGKAILSRLPLADRRRIVGDPPYAAFTDHTLTTAEDLDLELERAAADGYAVDREETEVGASCVAAPIVGADGLPVGAISVAGLSARVTAERVPEFAARVREWAERLSADLVRTSSPVGAAEVKRTPGTRRRSKHA
jgi:IclR family transcriptional regulator, acetate operon repressor